MRDNPEGELDPAKGVRRRCKKNSPSVFYCKRRLDCRLRFFTAFQMVRHRFNIYASGCAFLLLCRGDGDLKLVTRFGVIRRV